MPRWVVPVAIGLLFLAVGVLFVRWRVEQVPTRFVQLCPSCTISYGDLSFDWATWGVEVRDLYVTEPRGLVAQVARVGITPGFFGWIGGLEEVAEVELDDPQVTLSVAPEDWGRVEPLQVGQILVNNGRFRAGSPQAPLRLDEVGLEVENFHGPPNRGKVTASLAAVVGDSGNLRLELETTPHATAPNWNLDGRLGGLQLAEVSAFFQEHYSFQVEGKVNGATLRMRRGPLGLHTWLTMDYPSLKFTPPQLGPESSPQAREVARYVGKPTFVDSSRGEGSLARSGESDLSGGDSEFGLFVQGFAQAAIRVITEATPPQPSPPRSPGP